MLKRLMMTTALVAITSSAFAASPVNQADKGAVMNPAATHYVATVNASDILATKLIGQSVYSGMPDQAMMPKAGADTQAQADKKKNGNNPADTAQAQPTHDAIGDINNLVVAQDGSVDAVIIGVGGFLGMGEKNVAVPFDSLSWSVDANGKPVAYLNATKDDLQNAPSFDVSVLEQNGQAHGNPNAPDNQMALNPAAPNTVAQDVAANNPDNAKMTTVDATKISANNLNGTTDYDSADHNVGEVGDVIVSQDGKIDAVVVDVGGFLGIGEKPVAIAFEDLDIRKDEKGNLTVFTSFTKDQLDNAPQYDKDAYKTQRDTMRLHTQG